MYYKKKSLKSLKLLKNNISDRKIGIAFSGGGLKGFVHIGVIKALEEYGLKFDYISGTSVGSIVGAFYANGYTSQKMLEIGSKLNFADIKTSKIFPSKSEGLQSIITNEMGNICVEELQTPFSAVAVDIKTMKECVISNGNLASACAGSCAVPGMFVPVKFEDMLLCDGGLRNALPADVLKKNGCDFVISVDIGGGKDGGAKSTKMLDVLTCALRILIEDTSFKGYLYSDVVIKPNVKKFSFSKKDNYLEMVEEGYRATIEAMPKILELFARKKHRNIFNRKVSSVVAYQYGNTSLEDQQSQSEALELEIVR